MRFFLYEDSSPEELFPLALLRPAFELICGRECLRRRVQRWFPGAQWGVATRPWLGDVYREEHPECRVNDLSWLAQDVTLLINGRWMPDSRIDPLDVQLDTAGFVDGKLVWIALAPEEASVLDLNDFSSVVNQIAGTRRPVNVGGTTIRYPWDLVNRNGEQLERDFADEGVSQNREDAHVQCLGNPQDVYISPLADVDPYVVIDARNGPVSIDQCVHVQSFTRIEGPCHIGKNTQIFRALIRRGTTIGETCRVGGEIEESIVHSYVNKYHEGFLGHSYVCPWVNLGAITSTSDLKNNYNPVDVPLTGELIDSGSVKVGSFIGDHTKTAIDSMFNTGSSIGVMTMVLPGGRLLPRHIPSFCNVYFGELADNWPLDEALAAAKEAMKRRNCTLTNAAEKLIRDVHAMTQEERSTALNRATNKSLNRL